MFFYCIYKSIKNEEINKDHKLVREAETERDRNGSRKLELTKSHENII